MSKEGITWMEELISAALVTKTELVVDRHVASEVVDWLANHGHQIVNWEGLIGSPKGKYTVALEYSFRHDSQDHRLEPFPIEEIHISMEKACSQFIADRVSNGSELYFCIKLKDKTDLGYRKMGRSMRVLAALLGILFIVLPTLVLTVGLVQGGISLSTNELEFLAFLGGAPLLGAVFLWSSIKGRGPGHLGDGNWSRKLFFRRSARYPDGTRKWRH